MHSQVNVLRGRAGQEQTLENLYQLYDHDFADFLSQDREHCIQDDGRYPVNPWLPRYWSNPACAVYFIHVGGALAGFALLDRTSHVGDAVDVNVSEFFVARPYRRGGVGSAALGALIAGHPGEWEIAMMPRNIPAQSFWPRAIAGAGITHVTRLQGDGVRWTGPVLRFNAR